MTRSGKVNNFLYVNVQQFHCIGPEERNIIFNEFYKIICDLLVSLSASIWKNVRALKR